MARSITSFVISGAMNFLKPQGLLALETGIDQHPQLLAFAKEKGFSNGESLKDLSGRDRFLLLRF